MLGVSALRKWEENGLLTPERTPTGHHRYHVAGLQKLMHEKDESPSFTCAIYARVSTKKQEDAGNLDRQTGQLSAYAAQQGWPIFAVISDTASGLNEHRHGLQKVLQMVARRDVSVVLVEYKDRKVLVLEHLQLWQRREKKTAARIHKITRQDPTSRKLPGLRSKLEKQQRKVGFYQQHAEQSTFPPVIFGSRELYLLQFKEGVNQVAWRLDISLDHGEALGC